MAYNDVFKEQLVARESNSADLLKKMGVVFAGIVIIFALGMIPVIVNFGLIPFILVAVGWGALIIIRRFNVEYEYIFTNGELDIDKIFNKSKRKSALSIDVRKFVVMVNRNRSDLNSEIGNINETLDYSTGNLKENSYAAVFEKDGKRVMLLLDPNEVMLDAIKMYIPRKVKK